MDQERARIQDDLRGLLEGEVSCDDITVELYSSDASIYQIQPSGVVFPRHVEDVVACVQYAALNKIPIHARGAGSGLAGESLGTGIVLDFTRHMRKIVRVEEGSVCVQPGLLLSQLNAQLKLQGRHLPIDSANADVTSLGGMIAVDASGSRRMRYGSTRDYIKKLEVVLADGTVLRLGQHLVAEHAHDSISRRRRKLVVQTSSILSRDVDLIEHYQPSGKINHSGYQFADVYRNGRIDLARLLVGSEGTLALVTEAEIKTVPISGETGVALLFFDSIEKAARAVQEILAFGVNACDLIDRRHVTLARESEVHYDLLIPAATEVAILVECEGPDKVEVRDRIAKMIDYLRDQKKLSFEGRYTLDTDEKRLYWRLSTEIVPRLYGIKGTSRPLPFIEDISIPPLELPKFLQQLPRILRRHQVTASLFGHVGHGQLHIRPFLNLSNPEHVVIMRRLAEELYEQVLKIGGSISGEHADGLSRTWHVRRQYGPLFDSFREVKHLFDPSSILNPGKIIGDDPDLMTRNLRPTDVKTLPESNDENRQELEQATDSTRFERVTSDVRAPGDLFQLQWNWSAEDALIAANNCNGCGVCRTQSEDIRMCPIFHFLPREESSPRAKANLMRSFLTGRLPQDIKTDDAFKEVADLCVNCHMCRLECPAGVDIPRLMSEAKAQYVMVNGLRPAQWLMTRLDLVGTWASRFSGLANWVFGNPQMRWLLEKAAGIAQGRKLPRVAKKVYLKRAARHRLTKMKEETGPKVLYFVDTYANFFDPPLAEATVAVLQHNGASVFVPPKQSQSGMSLVSSGVLDRARQQAARNVSVLAEAVRQGYHIVTSEPSAALCLGRDYPELLDDEEAQLVADNTSEACTYLWQMHGQGNLLLDFQTIDATIGYHLPCHLKALEVGSPGENLLRLIPGLNVLRQEKGCSGMAGTFGLKRENYRASLRAGLRLMTAMRNPALTAGATECSSCKIQMEQGTTKPTIHPLKLLALAYGLKPEFEELLHIRGTPLTVT